MGHPTPQFLAPDKEALGRVVIAEFEWKQQQQKRERRMRAWKIAMHVGWGLLLVAGGVFIRVRQIPITTYDIVGWLIVMGTTAAFVQYTVHEEVRKLHAEVDALKQAVREMHEKRTSSPAP